MKIVMVSHYFGSHQGGVELVADRLARELSSRYDIQLVWVASDCDSPPEAIPHNLRVVPMRSWNGVEKRTGLPLPIWGISSLRQLSRLIRAADIVIIHDCLYPGNRLAGMLARRHKKPLVVVCHVGMIPYRKRTLRAIMHTANKVLAVPLLRSASNVVMVSGITRRYFEGLSTYPHEFVSIPNGVDTTIFHPSDVSAKKTLRARWGVYDNRPILAFVGRFVEKKGLYVLRGLVEAINEAWWLFAGWGPISPASWGAPNLKLVGKIDHDELASVYQASDLLVLPSIGEGFPLVVQEAMATGLAPLCGTDVSTADPGATGLIFGERVDLQAMDETIRNWSVRIRELLSDPSALSEPGWKRAAYARQNWSWSKIADAYMSVLNSVCSINVNRNAM